MIIIHENTVSDNVKKHVKSSYKAGRNIGDAVGYGVSQLVGRPLGAVGIMTGAGYGALKGSYLATKDRWNKYKGKKALKKYIADERGMDECNC